MDDFRHDLLDINGVRLHTVEEGSGPLVVLLHGFPELWYSWRHQLAFLAERGFHAVAIDQRGYGRSSAAVSGKAPSRVLTIRSR